MRVRVTRKLADRLDGIDLSRCHSGDLLNVSDEQAHIMIAERWAEYARRDSDLHPDETAGWDRRRTSGDLYERLKNKREMIARDRRHLRRRSSDVMPPGTPHAA